MNEEQRIILTYKEIHKDLLFNKMEKTNAIVLFFPKVLSGHVFINFIYQICDLMENFKNKNICDILIEPLFVNSLYF